MQARVSKTLSCLTSILLITDLTDMVVTGKAKGKTPGRGNGRAKGNGKGKGTGGTGAGTPRPPSRSGPPRGDGAQGNAGEAGRAWEGARTAALVMLSRDARLSDEELEATWAQWAPEEGKGWKAGAIRQRCGYDARESYPAAAREAEAGASTSGGGSARSESGTSCSSSEQGAEEAPEEERGEGGHEKVHEIERVGNEAVLSRLGVRAEEEMGTPRTNPPRAARSAAEHEADDGMEASEYSASPPQSKGKGRAVEEEPAAGTSGTQAETTAARELWPEDERATRLAQAEAQVQRLRAEAGEAARARSQERAMEQAANRREHARLEGEFRQQAQRLEEMARSRREVDDLKAQVMQLTLLAERGLEQDDERRRGRAGGRSQAFGEVRLRYTPREARERCAANPEYREEERAEALRLLKGSAPRMCGEGGMTTAEILRRNYEGTVTGVGPGEERYVKTKLPRWLAGHDGSARSFFEAMRTEAGDRHGRETERVRQWKIVHTIAGLVDSILEEGNEAMLASEAFEGMVRLAYAMAAPLTLEGDGKRVAETLAILGSTLPRQSATGGFVSEEHRKQMEGGASRKDKGRAEDDKGHPLE